MKIVENNNYEIKEVDSPELRDIFADLARDHGFPIYWYNEDNTGEIQINIHDTFISDLEEIIESKVYDYTDTLKELKTLIEDNENITTFYYN